MLKFFKKCFFFLIPFFIGLIIFIIWEPYNYFGIKPDLCGEYATPLARMREFIRKPSENIIIGDSRFINFDLNHIFAATGDNYQQLSTGGQAADLSHELYKWAKKRTHIKKAVLDVSFYEDRKGCKNNLDFNGLEYTAEHPLAYLTDISNIKTAFSAFWKDCTNRQFTPLKTNKPNYDNIKDFGSSDRSVNYNQTKYKQPLMKYTLDLIYPTTENFELSKENLESLLAISEDVQKDGGVFKFVTPPVQECIWDYVIDKRDLYDEISEYKEILSYSSDIYDFEWLSNLAKDQSNFYDGFHFDGSKGYEEFTDIIFTGKLTSNVHLISKKQIGIDKLKWNDYNVH